MPETKEVYENEWKPDIEFPKLVNYENLVYIPESLSEINYKEGQKLNTAINDQGQVITDLINTKLNTQTKQILDTFTFGSSGAIKIAIDDNNGIWISPNGILGKQGGVTKFAIDAYGNATFSGNLVAASGTLGTISSATITAGTFQTATSGQRIVISNSDNSIKIYDSYGTLQGTIYGAAGYGIYINGDLELVGDLHAGSGDITGYRIYVNAGSGDGIVPVWNNSITLGNSSYRWNNVYSTNGNFSGSVTISGYIASSLIPSSNQSYDLGSTSYKWNTLYTNGAYGSWSNFSSGTFNSYLYIGNNYIDQYNIYPYHFVVLQAVSGSTASGWSAPTGSMYLRTDDNVLRVKCADGAWRGVALS